MNFLHLCVAAAVANGDTLISGAEELRVKESDRIATMCRELKAMGAHVEERPDGMIIRGLGEAERTAGCKLRHGPQPWRPSCGHVSGHRWA